MGANEKVYDETPVARAVREAIDAVAAPDVRVQILHRALHMAREHQIPPAGEALQRFVEKHLKTATAFYLGHEAADSVMKSLSPIISLAKRLGADGARSISGRGETTKKIGAARVRSGVSPTGRDQASAPGSGTQPAAQTDDQLATGKYPTVQPLGSALPMVLVASTSAERCRGIEAHLSAIAAVQQVEDVVAFLDNLQATASLSPLVVIDCIESSVQPATLATLAHELPQDSSVLLWGASEEEHRDLQRLAHREQGWLRCGNEASPVDVASLVQVLLGD